METQVICSGETNDRTLSIIEVLSPVWEGEVECDILRRSKRKCELACYADWGISINVIGSRNHCRR